MPSINLTPNARIGALVALLVVVLGGAAIYLMHGSSQPTTATTPTPQQPATPAHHVATKPHVNPLLPAPVRSALENHLVVVVATYNPAVSTESLAVAEARAGATEAGVGFVLVDLRNDAVAGPLTALLPEGQILPNPGFLIYKRSGDVIYRTDGYLQRLLVAQAIKQAKQSR